MPHFTDAWDAPSKCQPINSQWRIKTHKNRRLNYLKGSSENNPIHQAIIVTESSDKKADRKQI